MQPFHGLWRRTALPILVAQIHAGDVALHSSLAKLNVAWLDEQKLGIGPESLAFTNVNTPQEWEDVLAILRSEPGQEENKILP
jgi:molybdopterin-guanine dinucleotide biosynthesis protein A